MSKNFTICVGTLGMGLWRSPDGGVSWARGRVGDGYQGGKSVYGLTVHPGDPAMIYAGTNDGLFRSNDRGASFERIPSPMDGMRVWRVAVDPVDPDTIFAGTSPVLLFRSRDAGESWEMVCDDFLEECANVGVPRVTALVIDPTDHRTIWTSVEVDGVRRSTDGGDTWTRVFGGGLEEPDVHDITLVPSSPKTVIATIEYDVLISADMGETWRNILGEGNHFPMRYTRCVTLKEGDPDVMFVATGDQSIGDEGAIQRSLDGGKTWETPQLPVAPSSHIECFATHPADPDLVLACTHYGQLFGSSDGGDWWVKLHKEVTENRGALVWVPN